MTDHVTVTHTGLLLLAHSHDDHGLFGVFELLSIVNSRYREIAIGKKLVSFGVFNNELFLLSWVHTTDDLVEDVKGPLVRSLVNSTRFF